MNQALIINDDYVFNLEKQHWRCTAMISGEKITIVINSSLPEDALTQTIKFDWECEIEDWLEENEPINNLIELSIN